MRLLIPLVFLVSVSVTQAAHLGWFSNCKSCIGFVEPQEKSKEKPEEKPEVENKNAVPTDSSSLTKSTNNLPKIKDILAIPDDDFEETNPVEDEVSQIQEIAVEDQVIDIPEQNNSVDGPSFVGSASSPDTP